MLTVLFVRARKKARTQIAVQPVANTTLAELPYPDMQPVMFDRLLSLSSDIFFVLDQSLRFKYVSSGFQRLLKIDPVPLDNSPIMCYLSTESYIELKKQASAAQIDTPINFAAELIGSDRALIHVIIYLQKQNGTQGETCFMGEIKTVKLKQEELNTDKNIFLQKLYIICVSRISAKQFIERA